MRMGAFNRKRDATPVRRAFANLMVRVAIGKSGCNELLLSGLRFANADLVKQAPGL